MIRRPPRSTRTTHSFPTRRSSDLSLSAGWNVHFFTASSVTWSNTPAGSDFSTRASETLPSVATSTITTTLPVVLAATASAGYFGGAVILAWISPCAGASARGVRSDERRVGTEGVSTGKYWVSPYP